MPQHTTEKLLFGVRLSSEQRKAEMDKVRTQQRGLTTDIEATRTSQKALTADYKAGKGSSEAEGSINQLRAHLAGKGRQLFLLQQNQQLGSWCRLGGRGIAEVDVLEISS